MRVRCGMAQVYNSQPSPELKETSTHKSPAPEALHFSGEHFPSQHSTLILRTISVMANTKPLALMSSTPVYGHLMSIRAIAEGLVAQGYEVTFCPQASTRNLQKSLVVTMLLRKDMQIRRRQTVSNKLVRAILCLIKAPRSRETPSIFGCDESGL